jgi:hypothetical protein
VKRRTGYAAPAYRCARLLRGAAVLRSQQSIDVRLGSKPVFHFIAWAEPTPFGAQVRSFRNHRATCVI